MEIKTLNITELKESEYNPRIKLTEDDNEFQALKNSLETFGYVTPIIVNANNVVIGGHQRLSVLKLLGYTKIDCVIVNINENDERLLNVALNKIDGEWDFGKLGELLCDMQSETLALTGFSTAEVEDIFNEFKIDSGDELEYSLSLDSDDILECNEIECRIGEFKFKITPEEYEQIIIDIKLCIGSQKQSIENGLLRRLLCTS